MKKELTKLIKAFPHVGEASKATLDRLKESRKTCVIMPTGTGKTIVAASVIDSLGFKTMTLSSTRPILNQTKESYTNLGVSSEYMTYSKAASLVKKSDLTPFQDIQLFVLDEFHRLGAKVWGKAWEVIEKACPEAKIIGTTATEIRYLDSARDMAREIFGRDVAYDSSLSECFNSGVLIKPKYIIGADLSTEIPEMEKVVETIQDQKHKKNLSEMIKKLRQNWEKVNGVSGIFKTYILENLEVNLHKMIVFHERISEVPDVKKRVENTLRGAGYTGPIKFYVANSENGMSDEEIQLFNAENSEYGMNILLAVNMLNEGVHVKGCEIAVMYRKTISKNIFLQQVGRVLSTASVNPPVILDLVQNISLSDGVILKKYLTTGKGTNGGKNRKVCGVYNLQADYEITDTLLEFEKICEAFDKDKQDLLAKIDNWYNLAKSGNLNAFTI